MHISTHAQNTPDRAAFIMASTDEVVTFKQLDDYSNQIAQLARARGLKVGDGIAIFMDNNKHFLEICWAAQRSGLYFTAVSSRLTAGEVEYIVKDCGPFLYTAYLSLQHCPFGLEVELKRIEDGTSLIIGARTILNNISQPLHALLLILAFH